MTRQAQVSDDAVERGDLIKRLLVEADRYERGRGAPMARLLREAVAALSATNSEAVSELVEALTKCRDKFREYEQLHRLKNTVEGTAKAKRNSEMADMCDAAIDAAKLGSRAPKSAG
jgi:hypothetical protein